MSLFIKKLCVLLLLLLVVSTVIQIAVSWRIRDKSIYAQDNFHVYKNQDNDLVFLGSSRCTKHFDPHYFKDSFGITSANLGVNGHGEITMAILRLQCYLKHNRPPKVALLNYDPLCGFESRDPNANTNLKDKHYYSGYAFLPNSDTKGIVDYFHFNLAERYLPLYALLRYGSLPDVVQMKGGKQWAREGYAPNTERLDTLKSLRKTAWMVPVYKYFADRRDSVASQLAWINDYCKTRHIRLICVQSPVFRSVFDPRVYSIAGEVCAELNIPYIEGNVDYIINDVRNFSDPDHINTTGIPKFMRLIASDPRFAGFFK